MKEEIKVKRLIAEEEIKKRVKELAKEISSDYKNSVPVLVGILKGSWVFFADLVREMKIPVICDFISIASYGKKTKSSGRIKLEKGLREKVKGKEIIIIEDIIDTGLSLKYLLQYLKRKKPKSIAICALLDKEERREVKIPVKYVGFKVPNKFIVGYGIDYAERFRYLPYIGYIERE
ncbi:MAG: hypoxanthine phosphoribosyltransferase [candidate division WOR-3 bacterium]